MSKREHVLVLSGGTGCNAIVEAFNDFDSTTFILPVSDNGGSSSEIQRVLSGPAIGDIRSRLVRLIPKSNPIKLLMEYRLSGTSSELETKIEWLSIIEGEHSLWSGIPSDVQGSIRAFLVYFNSAVLAKANRKFSFQNASIGNLFLCGASFFMGSQAAAIFLFKSICEILPHLSVVPVINTTSSVHIAAECVNGEIIAGQSEISHPSNSIPPTPFRSGTATPSPSPFFTALGEEDSSISNPNMTVSKKKDILLPSRISRIYYLNEFGNEIFPRANPVYFDCLVKATRLVYSCGSLYTSVIPCLTLRGVGKEIATSLKIKQKILLLNSKNDRETMGYDSMDFITAIVSACAADYGDSPTIAKPSDFITHLIYLLDGQIAVDLGQIEKLGIIVIGVKGRVYDEEVVKEAFDFIDKMD